jgi:uncharacterized protein (DUF2141 family)
MLLRFEAMRRSIFAACAAAMLLCAATLARAQRSATAAATPGGPAIEIEVVGLRNDTGQVGCSLFASPDGFPRDGDKVVRHVWAPIHARKALCRFDGMPNGRYAAVVFHDENSNGEFDENAVGMPLEGYGFSNNAAALFSPPDFKSASFDYSGRNLYQVVNIRY